MNAESVKGKLGRRVGGDLLSDEESVRVAFG